MAVRSTRTGVRFGVLGPLVIHVDGREVHLAGAKERGVVAFLLLRANEVVTTERLMEALWPCDPPATARNSLQVRVSHLRKVLGAGRIERTHGYRLTLTAGELDLFVFRELVAEARREREEGASVHAAEHLAEALALWRGDPLPEFGENVVFRVELGRLEEERLAAFEAWVDAELDLGRARELLPELEAAAAENPLREQLMGQLMVALYQAGQQAAALETYGQARNRLVEELGLEPGPLLGDLYQRILRQDPTLSPPPRPATRSTSPPLRRHVTVVVASFTPGSEDDPEAAGRRLDEARARAKSVLRVTERLTSPVGAGIVGTFGLPASTEDDPLRAVQAASELSQAAEVSVAVDTGLVLASDSALVDDRFVAALMRLADDVRAGDVVVGSGARGALGDAVEVAGSVLVSFDPTAEAIPRHFDAPLIGRETELERLQESFRWASRNRSSHLVTVLGPAGIGKSRLARELLSSVADEATVLVGRCLPYGSGAFWPLAEMVKQAAGDTTPEALLELLARPRRSARPSSISWRRRLGLEPECVRRTPSGHFANCSARLPPSVRSSWSSRISTGRSSGCWTSSRSWSSGAKAHRCWSWPSRVPTSSSSGPHGEEESWTRSRSS